MVKVSENLCNGCDLCCRKYKIYLFPSEAKAIARKFDINYKEFVTDYLDIYVELFPYQENMITDYLTFEFEKKKYFLFLTLALKQKDNACIFVKTKECSIYSKRPLICRLFPDFKFYGENYDFCQLDEVNKKSEDPRIFYPYFSEYLKAVKHNGFENTWKYLPNLNEKNIYFVVDGKKTKINDGLLEELRTLL